MKTSIEKLDDLQNDFAHTAPGPDAGAAELALRTVLQMFGPTLRSELPQEPGDLDDLLERGAGFLLSMRSDDAHPIELAQYGEMIEPDAAELPAGE